jgi:hypothetical protein
MFTPNPATREICDTLYALFRRNSFDFGNPAGDGKFKDVLPTLIRVGSG